MSPWFTGANAPSVLYVCKKGAWRWPDVHGLAYPVEPDADGIYTYGEFAHHVGYTGWTLPKVGIFDSCCGRILCCRGQVCSVPLDDTETSVSACSASSWATLNSCGSTRQNWKLFTSIVQIWETGAQRASQSR